jgi:hypothetical protein
MMGGYFDFSADDEAVQVRTELMDASIAWVLSGNWSSRSGAWPT